MSMKMSVSGGMDKKKNAGRTGGRRREQPGGWRLRHICDYFMALYKDKQHKDIIYDVKNFALRAKGVFSYIKNNLKPTILTHANEPSPTLYRYTYTNILIPVLFLGDHQKETL